MPTTPRRPLSSGRTSWWATWSTRCCWASRWPTSHGDTIYGETVVLDKWESKSKDDRGVVYVETKGYKQDGTVVCLFRRKVMVPKNSYLEARGGEQPGRPVPSS